VEALLKWMEHSAVGAFVRDAAWAFPTLEILHFLGLILLIGSMLIVDLRVLGVAREIPLRAVVPYLRWAIIGFGINLATGILFIFSDPFHYYTNLSFRLKVATLLLAGLNAVAFKLAADTHLQAPAGVAPLPAGVRSLAALSLVLWGAVIAFGRLIPYLQ